MKIVIATALLTTAVLVHAQAQRTVNDRVFSSAQAMRGEALYGQRCASCHGATLQGSAGPPLAGDFFVGRWQSEPLGSLFTKIRNTMPSDAPGTLTDQQTADLVAHILRVAGFPAGNAELTVTDDTKRIAWPARPAVTAQTAAGPARTYPPVGNLAQLMRGIFFPNANLIFTVQTRDPAAPAPPPSPNAQGNGFSVFDWGQGIYTGWQVVDNAAIALVDVSPLMLAPGLRCENGRPAPVTDSEWIKFTEDMIAVSKQIYKVSQSRNQDAVSEATGDLSDACAACHQAYRDVRGPGGGGAPGDPTANARRCMPRR